ncbi:MAG: hypothetical protein H0X43_10760 [Nitrosospira sp.]|nr:hypothetical protein [Nitrosospira sp.]
MGKHKPREEELKDKTEALTAQRDSLANEADVKEYVKARRELRQAEGDIEDGIADESLARMLKQDIARLRQTPKVRDYMGAVENSGILPMRSHSWAITPLYRA